MSEPTKTMEGWYAYHEFHRIDWASWRSVEPQERQRIFSAFLQVLATFEQEERNNTSSFGVYAIAGHKADLLFLFFRPTLDEVITCKNRMAKTEFADYLHTSYSYTSIVELSSYLAKPGSNPLDDPSLKPRLQPRQEKSGAICFYPMNKRRSGDDNWYMLPMPERIELMRSHGLIGRDYAGKVRQIVTGSVGFDDWEWGVTLYAQDPLQFKKLVYEMRFDEVSARYGDFGDFYVGNAITLSDFQALIELVE